MKVFGKIIPFLFFGVIMFVGARYMVFTSMIKLQKKEFRQQVLKQEHTNVKQLVISITDLFKDVNGIEWKEQNKEVVINNVYHEVLSIKKTGKNYIVSIIEDKEENELFRKFFDHSEKSKGLTNYLSLVFAMHFILPECNELRSPAECKIVYNPYFKHNQPNNFFFEDIKPPRC